jgi:hypothetical protein
MDRQLAHSPLCPWLSKILGICLITALFSGCAGPTTPLGAIWDLKPSRSEREKIVQRQEERPDELPARALGSRAPASLFGFSTGFGTDRNPTVTFDPPRQVLHGPRTVKVIIDDPRGIRAGYDLKVRYHGHDITRSFLLQAHVSRVRHGQRLVVEVPSVRLSAISEHLIEVGYRNVDGRRAVERYHGPICRAFEHHALETTDDFNPDAQLLKAIEMVSKQTGFNPAFTAALIAQESAFNPKSVSFARALGLTQVTPLAETEVSDVFSNWPRYPGINELSAPMLKILVMSGKVNSKNEWRLNPERSIRGGLAFAQMLSDHWLDTEGYSKIGWIASGSGMDDAEVARTRLILASYNSGYTRVLSALHRYGSAWLTAPELKEARKYVNRIFSYCDAFQQTQEESHENET